jgi:hypothetical protein
VVRVDAATGKPIAQSESLLVAARIDPKQRGQLQLTGVRVGTAAELKLYQVIVEKAELAK